MSKKGKKRKLGHESCVFEESVKAVKSSNKAFALAMLQQAERDKWEGEEMVSVFCFVHSILSSI
jgi:hypothetical protein